jgi:hypothetical protein
MGTINRFEEIEAWQGARQLSRLVYSLRCSRQISRFMTYLSTHSDKHRVREDRVEYDAETFRAKR